MKQNLTFLSKSTVKLHLFYGHLKGPLWRMTPVSRAYLYISFRIFSKGALPPGPPHRAPIERERETFHLQSPLLLSLKFPGKRTLFQVPQRGPYGQRCPFPQPSCTHRSELRKKKTMSPDKRKSFKVPGKVASIPWSAKRPRIDRNAPLPQPTLYSFFRIC
jgi:hypothetical protein